MNAPFPYFGGKTSKAHFLIPYIPRHNTYVEVFGGSAGLMFAKRPSNCEIYNDIDGSLVNLFRCLKDEEKFEKFYRMALFTLRSRKEFNYCKKNVEKEEDDVKRAYMFYEVIVQSFSSTMTYWAYQITDGKRIRNWIDKIYKLSNIHKRMMGVQIECLDWRKIFEKYDTEDTFFYCDPPYLKETRIAGEYRHEINNEDHIELIDRLLTLKGMVMLSGYPNKMYNKLLNNGFKYKEFKTFTSIDLKTRNERIEAIWLKTSQKIYSGNKLPEFE